MRPTGRERRWRNGFVCRGRQSAGLGRKFDLDSDLQDRFKLATNPMFVATIVDVVRAVPRAAGQWSCISIVERSQVLRQRSCLSGASVGADRAWVVMYAGVPSERVV